MTIRMLTSDVESSAMKYASSSEEIRDILSNLNAEQRNMEGAWEGDSFASFAQRYEELAPKIQEFSDLIEEIGRQIAESARIMAETDEAIANAVRG